VEIAWMDLPEDHDYAAAEAYLLLFMAPDAARRAADSLRNRKLTVHKAKDVLRAVSGSNPLAALLPADNMHVAGDLKKIKAGKPISPVLLVADSVHGRLIIADGHHRVCAAYHEDENAVVHAQLGYL
jgi:hypothetical protein